MEAAMELEDLMALCPRPEKLTFSAYSTFVRGNSRTRVGRIEVPLYYSYSRANLSRVLQDWFPVGSTFKWLGVTVMVQECAPRTDTPTEPHITVLAPGPKGLHTHDIVFSLAFKLLPELCKESDER